MRVMVTGGGTAGHVYPALSVVAALVGDARWQTRLEDVLWVGSEQGMEGALVRREEVQFESVATAALRGRSPIVLARGLAAMRRGAREARALVAEWRPDVVLATGGYVSAPLVLGARGRCPVLIYLPDMQPGLAIRVLSRYADRVAVSFDAVARYFPAGKVLVSGYPVRQELHTADKRVARRALGLPEGADERVVLVLGGSRGARSINTAVSAALPELLALARVLHISGYEDYANVCEAAQTLTEAQAARYRLYPYAHEEMTDLLAAADLVVARSGAATLGEFPAVGLPAVLAPYPYAGQHQEYNARFLVERGAARMVLDRDLQSALLSTVRALLGDAAQLEAMGAAARAVAVPDAAQRIAAELARLAGCGGGTQ